MGTQSRKRKEQATARAAQSSLESEMQRVFDAHGFTPSPACPPELLETFRLYVFYILRAYAAGARPEDGLVEAVLQWFFRYDELARAQPTKQSFEYKAGRVSLRLACGPGCNHCCVTPVSTIPPETVIIAGYIAANFTKEQTDALYRRVGERKKAVGGAQHLEFMCPLNVDGKCSIYDVRPFHCRKYHSFDENACRQRFIEGDFDVDIPKASVRFDESKVLWESADSAFATLGIDTKDVDFIPSLEIALQTENLVSRFVSGEPLFAKVRWKW